MRTKKGKSKTSSFVKYLPVLIILLSITIMVGSTFAYFTDRKDASSNLTFSKVELSSETTTGVDGVLNDVIPGSKIVDGAVAFSKSIDSEAIYVRAKISFSLPTEFANDSDMIGLVKALRNATDFNIMSTEQNGAVWSAKDGNYFYLLDSSDNTKLKRVDDIYTYTLASEVVVPRDLEQLEDNAQYMKAINFHIAFEAIQADNVSEVLEETKVTFDEIFPMPGEEKAGIFVSVMNSDLMSVKEEIMLTSASKITAPEMEDITDKDGTTTKIFDGWYTDATFTTEFDFDSVITSSISLYPKYLEVSEGLVYTEIYETESATAGEGPTAEGEIIGYSVAKGTCEDSTIIIPNTYNGKPIIEVAERGFYSSASLESIYLPNTITTIGNWAFGGCTNLNLSELPSALTTIKEAGFRACTSLTLTSLPNGLVNLEKQAFYECESLALTSLPDGITSLSENVFYRCSALNLEKLPDGLTSIGFSAFANCSSLAFTSLPSGLTTIGNMAFSYCNSLALTSLPEGLTTIGSYVFECCTNLALTSLPSGLTSIGQSAFSSCSNIELTSLPSGITSIGSYAFYGCINIKIANLPSTLTRLSDYAFRGCTSIENLTLNNLTYIGSNAFEGCTSLKRVIISNALTESWGYVFRDCTALELVVLPSSFTNMGSGLFRNCNNLNYLLCESKEVAKLAIDKGVDTQYIYGLETTGYDSVTFTDSEVGGITIGVGSDGTKAWVRSGAEGAYTYYKQYIERTVTFMDVDLTTTYQSVTVEDGLTISEPTAPTHSDENATFDGWYMESGLTNKFDFSSAITSNITLYPKYNLGYTLTVMDLDNQTQLSSTLMQKGDIVEEIEITNPVDENGTTTKIVEGWYSDSVFTTAFEFGNELTENTTLYPKVLTVSSGLSFTELYENASDSTEITSYSVAKGTCADTEMVIPHMYLNKPVTQITARGFRLNTLKNIYIPNTVVIIGMSAFSEDTALQSVVIPDSVTTINSEAFYNCAALTSITIGENVKTIGSLAFRYCQKLTKVYYNATNMNDVSSSTNIFNGSGATTGVELIIGNNVTRIPNYVFETTLGFAISDIIFEEGSICTSIGDYAFGNSENLVNLTFPSSMETIGSYAFVSCDKLETVIIPDNVTSIGEWAFQQNPSLKTVVLSNNLTILNSGLFSSCNALENVDMPKNLLEISYATFMDCRSLKTITIPESVVTIGGSAFRGCSGLTEINFNAVAVTGSSSMLTNIGITGRGVTVNIGAKVSQVPANLFSGSGIKNVNFEEGSVCTLIGTNAFSGSTTLLSVNLPDSLITIEANAFSSCYALTSIIVPKNVTTIGNGAFSYCYKLVEVINLSSLVISKGATTHGSIASYALNVVNSKELSKIVEINDCIFYNGGENNTYLLGCNSNETNLVLPNNCNGVNYDIYKYAFYKDNVLIDITIPGSVNSIGVEAFKSANYLERVVILEGVTTIQQKAFQECFNLKSIIIPSSSTIINSDYTFASLSGYILVVNETIASLVVNAKGNYVYVLDTTTDFSGITFTDTVDTGDVNGTYNDGTNYYVRTGNTGSYVYYKKYTA